MKDLITVIVPVYNVEEYLDKCVQSIVNQTHTNIEVILIDDGSPDNCPLMCDEWAKKDMRIKVVHKDNGGVSSARNVGLNIAKGNWISFVDSDDWIDEDMLETLLNYSIFYKLTIVNCAYYPENNSWNLLYEDDATTKNENFTNIQFLNLLQQTSYKYKIGQIDASIWGYLFSRSAIRDLRFDEALAFGEDIRFLINVIKESNRVGCTMKRKYHYLHRENSACNVFSPKCLQHIYLSEHIIENEVLFNQESIEFWKVRGTKNAYFYIKGSVENGQKHDDDNIKYSKLFIEKYFKQISSRPEVTWRFKIKVFIALYMRWIFKFYKI